MGFSKHAATYDAYAHIQSRLFAFLAPFFSHLSQDARCADIGCGTGRHTQQVARNYPSIHIDAFDASKQMIELASAKYHGPNIHYFCQDWMTVDPKNPYDLIVSNATFQWMADPKAAFLKVASALKSGGKMAVTVFSPETFSELQHAIEMGLGPVELQAQSFKWVPSIKDYLPESLSVLSCERHRFLVHYPSLMDLLKTIKYSGTSRRVGTTPLFSHPHQIQKVEQLYTKQYGGIRTTYDVMVCVGVKK